MTINLENTIALVTGTLAALAVPFAHLTDGAPKLSQPIFRQTRRYRREAYYTHDVTSQELAKIADKIESDCRQLDALVNVRTFDCCIY